MKRGEVAVPRGKVGWWVLVVLLSCMSPLEAVAASSFPLPGVQLGGRPACAARASIVHAVSEATVWPTHQEAPALYTSRELHVLARPDVPTLRLAALTGVPELVRGLWRQPLKWGADVVTAQATNGTVVRVSVDSLGWEGNGHSGNPMISPDGRYVVFESGATNLDVVRGDANAGSDIFLHDLVTRQTSLACVTATGEQPNSACNEPFVTRGAQYVAFCSASTNLVPSLGTNLQPQVFVHNRVTREIRCASIGVGGGACNGIALQPCLSEDGQVVAFVSSATDLVVGDANGQQDVFVRDFGANRTELVSVATNGSQADRHSSQPSLSSDGRYVAFASTATNLVPGDGNGVSDVFLRDRQNNRTTCVSVSSTGGVGNAASSSPAVSDDAHYVAFVSSASNLASGDGDGSTDIFVRDTVARATELISVGPAGEEIIDADDPSISGDGRYVAFTGTLVTDAGNVGGLFVRDRLIGQTFPLNIPALGASAPGFNPSISGGGRYVVFESFSAGIVPGDTNGKFDVFVYQRPGPGGVFAGLEFLGLQAPVLTSITPNEGKSGETVVCTITGQRLTADCQVYLRAAWQRLVVGQVLGVAPDGTSLTVQLPLVALRENVLDLWVVTRSGYAASLPQAFSIMSPVTSPELSASTAGQLQWPIRHPVWVWGRLHNSSARAAVGVSDQTGPATGITLLRVYCSSGIQRIFGPWFDALPRPGETPQIAWFLVAAVNPGMSFLYTVDAVKPQEPSEWKTTFITTEHEAITVARYSEFGQFLIDRLQANLGATGTTAMHPGWVYHNTPTGWPPVIQPDREAIASKYRWAWGYAMRHFRESARGAKVWGQVGYLCDLLSKEFDKLCQETPWPERLFFERAREDAEHWRDNFYAAGARDDLFAPGENLLPGIIEAWKEDVRRTYTQTTIPPRGPPPPPPPIDPNYKAGPGGDERTAWIGGGTRPAVYYIHFENKAEAKGAAINVVVTDRLDPDFDWRTVELDPAVVGASHPAITRAEFNAATGVITWTLAGINLPPNVNPPEGEGWVAFAVRPKAGLAHLTELRNRATVRFDSEAPMDTNETVVRVDMEPPTSKVNSAEPALGTSYKVAWSGNDGQGSGVSVYNVYVSEDGGPYVRWVGPTTATSEMFEGRPGHRYAFVCLATDMVGNVQAAPAQPDLVLDVPIDRGLLISLDFNGDNRINEWDLAAFIEAWKAANAAQPAKVDPRFDLAPWRGTIPNVESQPDGKIDHRDAALVLGAYLKLHGAEGPLPARIRKMALPPAPRAAP